jgi:lipopolysaccharide export system protein LptA
VETNAVKKAWVLTLLAMTWLVCWPGGVSAQDKGKKPEPGKAGAQEKSKKPEDKEIPLFITSSRLEADQTAGVVQFSGQVKAVYGDSTLYSDNLWVYFQTAPPSTPGAGAPPAGKDSKKAKAPKEAGPSPLGDLGGEKISRIVARGQVRFVQEDRLATGQEAVYYKDKDELVLTGNPQIWRGENTVKGERIVFNLKDNKMHVESSPQKRVEAHMYSAAKGSAKGPAKAKDFLPLGGKGRKDRKP